MLAKSVVYHDPSFYDGPLAALVTAENWLKGLSLETAETSLGPVRLSGR